jgi:hypothetical protein
MEILTGIGVVIALVLLWFTIYRTRRLADKLLISEGRVNEVGLLRSRGLLSEQDAEKRLHEIHEDTLG